MAGHSELVIVTGTTAHGILRAELVPSEGGTFKVVEITLTAMDGQALSSTDQYDISIPQLVAQAEQDVREAEHEDQQDLAWARYSGEGSDEWELLWDRGGLPLPGRPDGGDWWYQLFARVFLRARATTKSPAVAIAEANGYPVTAVHRWTREARRRGFLPPDIRSQSNRNR